MNWQIFLESKIVEDLGWTLVHSVWEIGLVAAMLFFLLNIVRPVAVNLRYGLSIAALLLSLILPVVTFIQLTGSDNAKWPGAAIDERSYSDRDPGISPRNIEQLVLTDTGHSSGISGAGATNRLFAGVREFFGRNLQSVLPFAVYIWLLCVALFSLRLGGGIWQLRRYRTRGVDDINENWQQAFSALCERLDIVHKIKILQSTLVETPIAIGFFKPLIILPASIFLQISPRELETIIAHELIHIRRYDPFVNIVQSAIEVLFFYHPGVWWISRQIRREREFAADNAVTEIFNDSHVVYANALANLEEIRLRANRQTRSLATAANGGNLMQRIQRILQIKTEMKHANSAWSAGLAFMLISAVLAMVFSFNPSSFVNAQNKASNRTIAIGFVSIPPLDRSNNPPKDSDATARLMIAKLAQYKIPAIGFVQGAMVSDGEKLFPVRANIIRLWRDAGLEIGIGNFKHLWFYNTPYDEYVAGVEKNEAVVKKILGEKNLPLRYFSYPYLNTGKSVEERDRFEKWLGTRGLRSVKYTIDNDEWMYSYAYDRARNDNDVSTMNEIRIEFINYMDKMFAHDETYSQEMFGRDIPQTMVLTPSRLVADSSDELFGMIRKRGYSFVSMDEAQADDAYKTPENMIGDFGNSWFERWTSSQGKKLRDEPKVSADVLKVWNENKPKTK